MNSVWLGFAEGGEHILLMIVGVNCVKEILAQRLRDCRAKFNYTQIQAATYADITERAYANYELERQMPKLDILIRIADVYKVSLDYLVGCTDNPNVNE